MGSEVEELLVIKLCAWFYCFQDNDLLYSGGTEAARNQFPYQVAFFIYVGDGQSVSFKFLVVFVLFYLLCLRSAADQFFRRTLSYQQLTVL